VSPTSLPVTGEPITGDPVTGEPETGEPETGEPLTGGSLTCEPVTGEPLAGETVDDGAPVPSAPPTAAPPGERPTSRREALDAPPAVTGRYLPALDGVRAFAVAGVLAYHLGFGWASGGYLGVDLFFVLSGFLITTLLLEEWAGTGGIRLGAFWARRARRLLPALFLVLAAIALYVVLEGQFGPPGSTAQIDLGGLRGDALATLFYFANWHAIFAHQSYFAQFLSPSPLGHTWSLAIEEQFYLLWPLVLIVLLRLAKGRWRRWGVILTIAGICVSALLMAVHFHPGADPTRDYFGTDTRIFDMLAGATVAMVAAARPQPGRWVRWFLHAAGPVAAVALGIFWATAGTTGGLPPGWMFRGGFLVTALLAAVVVADARLVRRGPLGMLLSLPPLRWIGKISYGIYLWHWPIFIYLTQQRTGLSIWALDLVRLGATLLVATVSFYLVEQPIRRRRLVGWPRFALAPVAAAATAGVVLVATVPAVAAPYRLAPSTAAPVAQGAKGVPGSGGYGGETPISLLPGRVISPSDPLRVMMMGDSVMYGAALGIIASLGATGEATGYARAIAGFGLSTATGWRTGIPELVDGVHPDLIVATWSWDDDWALRDPAGYGKTLERAIRVMLAPGNGVSGVIFTQLPPSGPTAAPTQALVSSRTAERSAAQLAWQHVVSVMPRIFPGRVMYLPVASSVLLGGRFSSWLPPTDHPGAPRSDWVRVRMVDNVHMCPAGVVRYAAALLADLSDLYHLAPAQPGWWDESWTTDPRYNTPAGACPDDHPAG
jgi:peptidoglycan/LPS O-acetylase OafA/YrhL